MSVTIKNIAKIAGVTPNTVSRALRNKEGVNKETAEKIHQISRMMGYTPNIMAQSLVLKKTRTIGLAATEIKNPYQTEFIAELILQLRAYDYHLITSDLNTSGESDTIAELLSRKVDGLIVGSVSGVSEEVPLWKGIEIAKSSQTPLIMFGEGRSSVIDYVNRNYRRCAEIMTSHLIKRGYTRIAFFAKYGKGGRADGYMEALEKADMAGSAEFFKTGVASMETGRAEIIRYIEENRKLPEAIVAQNDLMAIGIMAGLVSKGYKVPDDVAVVGFDNIDFGKYTNPPLTSIGFSDKEVVKTILEMLFERIDGKRTEPKEVIAEPVFRIRNSCGSK
jgi:LacI family transcriptional regulator